MTEVLKGSIPPQVARAWYEYRVALAAFEMARELTERRALHALRVTEAAIRAAAESSKVSEVL